MSHSADKIDRWFRDHCDGQWEHRWGVTIESCDNPGWQLTVDSFESGDVDLASLAGTLSRQYDASVTVSSGELKIFCRSLSQCLDAAAEVLGRSAQ